MYGKKTKVGIALTSVRMDNKNVKLIHCNIHFNFCQERPKKNGRICSPRIDHASPRSLHRCLFPRFHSKIDYLLKEKQKLEKYKNSFISSETKRKDLELRYEKEKRKYFLLKSEKENFDKNQKIESELELLNQNKNEIENSIKALNKKEHEISNNKKDSKLGIFDIVLSIIIVIAMILIWIFSDNRAINFTFSAISGLVFLIIIIKDINSNMRTKKHIKEVNIYNTNLLTEQNILKENLDNIVQKFNIKAEEYDCLLEEQFNELKELCQSREELEYVKKIHDFSLDEIIDELDNKSNDIYEMDVSIRLLNQDMENSNQKIEQLIQLEEELYNLQEERNELKELNNIFEECNPDKYESHQSYIEWQKCWFSRLWIISIIILFQKMMQNLNLKLTIF